MQGETGNKCRKLCEHASAEQDPKKLLEIVHEINRMLEEKEQRLTQAVKTKSLLPSGRPKLEPLFRVFVIFQYC